MAEVNLAYLSIKDSMWAVFQSVKQVCEPLVHLPAESTDMQVSHFETLTNVRLLHLSNIQITKDQNHSKNHMKDIGEDWTLANTAETEAKTIISW